MNKDYAKKRRSRFPKQKPYQSVLLMPSWAWMISGLALGVGLSTAVYWKTHQDRKLSHADVTIAMNDPQGKTKAKSLAKRSTSESREGRFDFYNLLPNMAQDTSELLPEPVNTAKTVTTPHPTLDKALATAKESVKETTLSSTYMIQAGSFRQRHQAEELKAKLAISGYQASIQTYRQDNRETWHRVSIGPFKNKEHALASQQKLEQTQALHSLIIKNRV